MPGPVVLVVHERAVIREAARCLLEAQGYHVIESSTAAEALTIVNAGRRIDLLLRICENANGMLSVVVVANQVAGVAAAHRPPLFRAGVVNRWIRPSLNIVPTPAAAC
jgi:CheY-like chemotaxis protein